MSEQPSTPPRPKPGSLRDRIAAFEKPTATAAASPPPPVPRPKPGGLQWKPKMPSPPSSPSTSEERKHGGSGISSMSASDAKESIGKGGSLKERMAALQNKGAFGAPPPVAPKPPLEKPKWKPPPVIAKVDQDEDEAPADQPQQQQQDPSQAQAEVTESPQPRPSAPASAEGEEGVKEVIIDNEALAENQGGEPAEVDPEEEERQRRAAIAARMARLGGTRVGMAPMFGAKPVAKPPPPPPQPAFETKPAPDDELGSTAESTTQLISDDTAQVAAPIAGQGMVGDDIKPPVPVRRDAEPVESPPPQSRNTPSMPMPSAPRRAGPPRKKVPKTPEVPPAVPTALGGDVTLTPETIPVIESTVIADSIKAHDREPEMDVPDKIDVGITPPVHATAEEAAKPLAETAISETIMPPAAQEQPQAMTEQASLAAVLDAPHETIPDAEPHGNEDVAEGATPAAKLVAEPVPMEEHMEEDEAEARRRRVAERLAKMGAVNPFAPQRRSSQQSVELDEAAIASSPPPPPIPPKRMSMEKRKSSIDSVSTVDSRHVRSPVTSPSFVPLRKDSVSSAISDVAISSREGTQDDTHVEPTTIPEEIDELAAVEPFSARTEESNEPTASEVEDVAAPLIIPTRPVPGLSTRPAIPQEGPIDPALSVELFSSASPVPAPTATPPAKFIPPPRITPRRKEFEYATGSDSDYRDYDSDAPPRRIPPRVAPSDENMDNESAPLPIPNRSSLELKTGPDGPPPPPPLNISTRPTRSVPLPPQPLFSSVSDLDQDSDNGEILPMRPRNQPTSPTLSDAPLYVPPPQGMDSSRTIEPSPLRQSSYPAEELEVAAGVEQEREQEAGDTSPSVETQDLSVSEHEVLDEEEGDPIDPTFHSPSRPASTINLQSSSATQEPKLQDSSTKEVKDEAKPESEEDGESTKRQTLAERMAKLGGIKFGAAPIPAQISRPPPREVDEEPAEQDASVVEQPHVSEEEEERARKERIAAKLASMGGMRIGMLPPGAGVLPVPRAESNVVSAPPAPSQPAGQEHDEDEAISASQHSLSTDDGVKVEAEESDMEEVKHEEVREMEEVPPPVPSRATRRQLSTSSETVHVAPPVNRPPVPTGFPSRRSSVQTAASTTKRASTDSTSSQHRVPLQKPQSEYVMVEEPEEMDAAPAPLPPKPANRPPPPRAAPPPPPPSADVGENISSQWVLPSIPSSSLDMSDDGDLSMSWSKESVSDVSAAPPAPPKKDASSVSPLSPVGQPNVPHDGASLSADELMAVWGRVGVQVCEVATSFFEKSKKSLVGDGTYAGFVLAVLHEVPNAVLPHRTPPYGALVYAQHGGTVQKRTSDIMPGDVVELVQTKFKGHKGIQAYNQSVGFDETVVGIVSEFEHKKSKMRVFQANQHVGQQTVEAVSYRLEDLKSGDVKIYRVLENK